MYIVLLLTLLVFAGLVRGREATDDRHRDQRNQGRGIGRVDAVTLAVIGSGVVWLVLGG